MQYKLTPEQIREKAKERAKSYAVHLCVKNVEDELISFLEEATGEKIPEPFDESKVTRGSAWRQKYSDHALVVLDDTAGSYYSANGGTSDYSNRDGLAKALKNSGYSYIGQFDFKAAFSAGLPKQ